MAQIFPPSIFGVELLPEMVILCVPLVHGLLVGAARKAHEAEACESEENPCNYLGWHGIVRSVKLLVWSEGLIGGQAHLLQFIAVAGQAGLLALAAADLCTIGRGLTLGHFGLASLTVVRVFLRLLEADLHVLEFGFGQEGLFFLGLPANLGDPGSHAPVVCRKAIIVLTGDSDRLTKLVVAQADVLGVLGLVFAHRITCNTAEETTEGGAPKATYIVILPDEVSRSGSSDGTDGAGLVNDLLLLGIVADMPDGAGLAGAAR